MFIGSATRLTACSGGQSPALSLELRSATLDNRLTFSRASGATDIVNGTLTSYTSDVPRISVANGLLMEEARTNLAFGNTLTNGGDMTIASGQADPLGGTSAYLCTEGTSSATHVVLCNTMSFTAASYTISAFVKAGTCDRIQLRIASTVAANGYANFYLSGSGSVSATGAGVTAAMIQGLNGGWYRIAITFVATGSTSSENKLYALVTGSEGGNPTTTGSSRTFYAYGLQCEQSAFLTSYIPTTTTSATRAVENCTASLGSWFNATEGAMYVEATTGSGYDSGASTQPRLLRIDNGASSMVHEIKRNNSDNTSRLGTTTGSVTESSLVAGSWGSLALLRAAYAYRNNDMAGCLNGGTVLTDTTSPDGMPTGLTTLRVGSASSSGAFGGYVRLVRYWRARISNEQMKAMTT